jgi:hypothetical protein
MEGRKDLPSNATCAAWSTGIANTAYTTCSVEERKNLPSDARAAGITNTVETALSVVGRKDLPHKEAKVIATSDHDYNKCSGDCSSIQDTESTSEDQNEIDSIDSAEHGVSTSTAGNLDLSPPVITTHVMTSTTTHGEISSSLSIVTTTVTSTVSPLSALTSCCNSVDYIRGNVSNVNVDTKLSDAAHGNSKAVDGRKTNICSHDSDIAAANNSMSITSHSLDETENNHGCCTGNDGTKGPSVARSSAAESVRSSDVNMATLPMPPMFIMLSLRLPVMPDVSSAPSQIQGKLLLNLSLICKSL